jgi:hypothetical protein
MGKNLGHIVATIAARVAEFRGTPVWDEAMDVMGPHAKTVLKLTSLSSEKLPAYLSSLLDDPSAPCAADPLIQDYELACSAVAAQALLERFEALLQIGNGSVWYDRSASTLFDAIVHDDELVLNRVVIEMAAQLHLEEPDFLTWMVAQKRLNWFLGLGQSTAHHPCSSVLAAATA